MTHLRKHSQLGIMIGIEIIIHFLLLQPVILILHIFHQNGMDEFLLGILDILSDGDGGMEKVKIWMRLNWEDDEG